MTQYVVHIAPNRIIGVHRTGAAPSPLMQSIDASCFIYHSLYINMPSDLSYWIISAPLNDGDPGLMLKDVRSALGDSVEVGQWELPELKVGVILAFRVPLSAFYRCSDVLVMS